MSTIRHRVTPNGKDRWQVMWRESGKQHSRVFTSEAAARKWQALLDVVGGTRAVAALSEPAHIADSITVADQVREHVAALTGITDGTRKVYLSHLERIIEPTAMGKTPLSMLAREDVAAWVNDMDRAGVAAKTIANYKGLLSGALKTATKAGRIPGDPSAGMRLPRGDHAAAEHLYLTPAQFSQLHEAMTEHYRPLLVVLVGTGVRFGEATALRVGDVDLDHATARVSRAWQYTGKATRKIGSPKTKRSTRTVSLPSQVVDVLRPLVQGRGHDEYLLTAPKGGPIRQPVFYTPWRKAVAELDVRPRIHDLRHTFASWAIQAGVPLPVIQRQLGHESITTTVDTYGSLARSDFDAMAARISERLPLLLTGTT